MNYHRSREYLWLAFGLVLAVGTGLYNIGIIALDDYSNEISTMIPAQFQPPLSSWVHEGVHPPLARLFVSSITRTFLSLGVTDPVWQLRFALAFLALVIFSVTALCVFRLTATLSAEAKTQAACLTGFFFLSPLIFSRPMIESLAIPFVMASLWFATQYWQRAETQPSSGSRTHLSLSLVILAAGCLLRPQVGACAAALFLLPVLKRRYRDLSWLLLVGIVCILLTGWVDVLLGKKFHGTLRDYAAYNAHAGSLHGSTPFYVFWLFFVGLSLPPTFFSRFRGLNWKIEYQTLFVTALFFFTFVLAHSLFPHKEERFMIPAIPLFIMLLAPLLGYFQRERAQRKTTWRLVYFYLVNGILLVLVITQIPQSNSIDLVRAVDKMEGIRQVVSLEDSIVLFPAVYGLKVRQLPLTAVSDGELQNRYPWPCEEPLVVRFEKVDLLKSLNLKENFTRRQVFSPGILEKILVKTNPRHNLRRGQLEIWLPERCPDL